MQGQSLSQNLIGVGQTGELLSRIRESLLGLGRIAGFAMVRHHQRPGGQRHQLPREQEAERVGRKHHEVQAGEE